MLDHDSLASLGDEDLLRSLKAVAARANQITAALLQHLAEVDARGAHRLWACPTLQAYCVFELRLSEDEAQRRCRAARLVRQFPRLLDMVADSSLHLTGLLLVGPHLTPDNQSELLARVAFRTKREIERIVAEVAPRPDAPSLVQPLGPAADGVPSRAPGTWTALARGLAGFARELPPGVGPGDAPAIPSDAPDDVLASNVTDALDPSNALAPWRAADPDGTEPNAADEASAPDPTSPSQAPDPLARDEARHPPATSPLRYRVQFTADQRFVDLLAEARDLLWHRLPDGDLASVQRLALEALVVQLRQRKYAATRRTATEEGAASAPTNHAELGPPSALRREVQTSAAPAPTNDAGIGQPRARQHGGGTSAAPAPANHAGPGQASARENGVTTGTAPARAPANDGAPGQASACERQTETSAAPARSPSAPGGRGTAPARSPRRPHLPAALRREVWRRDDGRCTFVDARGVRCSSTAALEFHHEHAHALGGPSTIENLTLRCRAHNRLAAERDFGAEHVAARAAPLAAPRP